MMNLFEVDQILAKIKFAPSCVDMHWKWETAPCLTRLTPVYRPNGVLIRTTFLRPDTNTGELAWGYGRWWHIPNDASESAVVKTAFAAMKMILDHELMEAFIYDGFRPFNPHHSVDDLHAAATREERAFEAKADAEERDR